SDYHERRAQYPEVGWGEDAGKDNKNQQLESGADTPSARNPKNPSHGIPRQASLLYILVTHIFVKTASGSLEWSGTPQNVHPQASAGATTLRGCQPSGTQAALHRKRDAVLRVCGV